MKMVRSVSASARQPLPSPCSQSMKLKEAMKRPVWPSPNESKHRIGVGKGGLYATPSGKPVAKVRPRINIYRLARLGREAQERMDKRNES